MLVDGRNELRLSLDVACTLREDRVTMVRKETRSAPPFVCSSRENSVPRLKTHPGQLQSLSWETVNDLQVTQSLSDFLSMFFADLIMMIR